MFRRRAVHVFFIWLALQVLLVSSATQSPVLHAWLHGSHATETESSSHGDYLASCDPQNLDLCAVVLFSGGVEPGCAFVAPAEPVWRLSSSFLIEPRRAPASLPIEPSARGPPAGIAS